MPLEVRLSCGDLDKRDYTECLYVELLPLFPYAGADISGDVLRRGKTSH